MATFRLAALVAAIIGATIALPQTSEARDEQIRMVRLTEQVRRHTVMVHVAGVSRDTICTFLFYDGDDFVINLHATPNSKWTNYQYYLDSGVTYRVVVQAAGDEEEIMFTPTF